MDLHICTVTWWSHGGQQMSCKFAHSKTQNMSAKHKDRHNLTEIHKLLFLSFLSHTHLVQGQRSSHRSDLSKVSYGVPLSVPLKDLDNFSCVVCVVEGFVLLTLLHLCFCSVFPVHALICWRYVNIWNDTCCCFHWQIHCCNNCPIQKIHKHTQGCSQLWQSTTTQQSSAVPVCVRLCVEKPNHNHSSSSGNQSGCPLLSLEGLRICLPVQGMCCCRRTVYDV